MLNNQGFDLWAHHYDQSVGLSDEDGTYPFAGYREVLNTIFCGVLSHRGKSVLDIGFGTGTLTAKLYAHGCHISGQDFSPRMLALAQEKMPQAELYQGDFSFGLREELTQARYDAIVATYSLHHLSDASKIDFLNQLLPLLTDEGCIYIGDVAFGTRRELERCKAEAGELWDDEEIYFVYDELTQQFPQMEFRQVSSCAGVLCLTNQKRK